MNTLVDLLACPLCKLGLDEMQARAMEYSIYFMLALIYSLAGIFGFKEAPYYQVPEEAKATPKVDFSGLKRGAGADTTRH